MNSRALVEVGLAVIVCIIAFFASSWFVDSFGYFGYLGVFVFSLITSATIFLPVPSWALVFSLSSSLNPILLGIFAGSGSTLGELSGYLAGSGGRKLIENKNIKLFNIHKKWLKHADVLALFIVSFLPNPFFDIAGIAAGALKIPLFRFLLPVLIGKILRFILFAYFGIYFFNELF